ncbi:MULTISPECIES: four-helix bundle copper-binding protein [unclassified Acidovorax]|jgi:hypothetical protein|uniref:four-helix bundle copper-binding protein n=1 Tax=unclassified Acidovorax TaxID=2684926 RepID=UPI00070DC43B|nr:MULTISPECIES: four-helix bundle copper-binding protein [unclassified Acidovorax]KRC26319.1 ferredoxin [Acidovorax sp. Root219]MDZ7863910.1 four-helix bundle copper-binding protein [Acidovorax sp.]
MNHAQTQYQSCIQACLSCATTCNQCFAACLQEEDVKMMVRCIALDADCAAVCSFAASAMARNSEHAKAICALCAEICQACGDECAKHEAEHCQACAAECHKCAQECRSMASAR